MNLKINNSYIQILMSVNFGIIRMPIRQETVVMNLSLHEHLNKYQVKAFILIFAGRNKITRFIFGIRSDFILSTKEEARM